MRQKRYKIVHMVWPDFEHVKKHIDVNRCKCVGDMKQTFGPLHLFACLGCELVYADLNVSQ